MRHARRPRKRFETIGVAVTALACIAFMADGNVPGRGAYGENVSKGLDFIAVKLKEVREGGKGAEEALKMYEQAAKLAPDVVELQFWAAVSMYTNDRQAEALKLFRTVFGREARWVPLIPRLAKAGLFPDDAAKIKEVQAVAPKGAKW